MRVTDSQHGLTALATAGSYVVLLGWDMTASDIRQNRVLGFGIQRTRHSDGEVIWLSGTKTFKTVDANTDLGVPVSSFRHPFQSFQWADYTASPGQTYTYRIVAMQAPAGALVQGANVSLTVTTESVDQGSTRSISIVARSPPRNTRGASRI